MADKSLYRNLYDEIYTEAVESKVMRKYHDLGTAENIAALNALKGLPTRNLSSGSFEGAESISGEALAEHYLGRRLACSHCPVGCIHIAALREPYHDEPYFMKTHMICYDYEPIYALGSMLGIADPRDFLRLMERIEILGLDVMSAGVVLAWATEAAAKGLVSEKDTAGTRLGWGDAASYSQAVDLIVEQPNEFYRLLAQGVEKASARYGGEDFALSFGSNEMPGYHTGPAAYAGVLLGLRHSHLDNAGYSVDQKAIQGEKPDPKAREPEELAKTLINEEAWRQVLSSLVVCFFARGIYTPERTVKALELCGLQSTVDELRAVGGRIYRDKFAFKEREGFLLDSLRYPRRIFDTPNPCSEFDGDFLKKVIAAARAHMQRL